MQGNASDTKPPARPPESNSLRDHWENDVLPRLTPEMVYTDPSHRFQIASDRWRGGSPFRESKSGTSFAVWPSTLRFYDSGMGFAGDPISYVHSLKVGRWEYPKAKDWVEALRELSRLAGVEHNFPTREPSIEQIERARKWEERRSIFSAVYITCAQHLWSSFGCDALTHLIEERGFTESELRDLGVGLYPTLEIVQAAITEQQFNISLAEKCGVLTRKWEGYAVFPWHNPYGEPLTLYGHWPASKADIPLKKNHVGWKKEHDTARRAWNKLSEAQKVAQPWTDAQIPKKYACWNPKDESGSWLATKESPLYFDRVVKASHHEAVLVEGVTDAAIAQVRGDSRVMACVAASLSGEQVQTLKRHRVQRVNVCLDPDSAGEKGIISCIKSLLSGGIAPYVAPLLPLDSRGDGDPDRFIISHGIEAWKQHTSFDSATHGLRWIARYIVTAGRNGAQELSDAAREAIWQEAIRFTNTVDRQWEDALATYFWSEIKLAVGAVEIPELKESTIIKRESARATVSLLQGSDSGGSHRNSSVHSSGGDRFFNDKSYCDGDGGSGGGFNDNYDGFESRNDWEAPMTCNGEIGKWFRDREGNEKFRPLADFDFIITGEIAAPTSSNSGGGYSLKIKRSFDRREVEVVIFSLETITVKEFITTLLRKTGFHLNCRLCQADLVALIHARLEEYHRNRAGRVYRCIDRFGQQSDGTWVFADCQFKADGTPTHSKESGWIYNPQLGAVDHILCPEIQPPNPGALRKLIEAQRKFAGSSFMHFLLCDGYVAASLHFQEIMRVEKFFPILNPYGDPGSKKTIAVLSAMSMAGWGNTERGALARTSVSMAYERLKCLGSIPSMWDDPPAKTRIDRNILDDFFQSLYNGLPRQVRGNSQQPFSPMIPTSNHSLGETNPATKTRIIPLFMPVIDDGDRSAWGELSEARSQASGAFGQLVAIGYSQALVKALRDRLSRHLPTAHDRVADNLAILVFYTQKVAELAGLDIDVERWTIANLCEPLNESLTGLNCVADFFEKLEALVSYDSVGSWNVATVETREEGRVLALHLPSIWPEVEREFNPAYNRPVLERVLVSIGAIKNRSAKLHSGRDLVLAYNRAKLTARFDSQGNVILPNGPERINKKCLLLPESLCQALNLQWLLDLNGPDSDSPGGFGGGDGPDDPDGSPPGSKTGGGTDVESDEECEISQQFHCSPDLGGSSNQVGNCTNMSLNIEVTRSSSDGVRVSHSGETVSNQFNNVMPKNQGVGITVVTSASEMSESYGRSHIPPSGTSGYLGVTQPESLATLGELLLTDRRNC